MKYFYKQFVHLLKLCCKEPHFCLSNFAFLILLIIQPFLASASHIIGGELYYQYAGNNDYVIYLKVYRDCSPNSAQFDDPALIKIYDINDDLLNSIYLYSPEITQVQGNSSNPCLLYPPDVCVEEAIYSTTVNLPPQAGGFFLAYGDCCRNDDIINLTPSSNSSAFTVQIPDTSLAEENSSPYFVNYPPIVICNNEPILFDHSAFDLDGDSLVYSLCEPYKNGSPPFDYVQYNIPYSGSYPLDANPALAIDLASGLLTGTPILEGRFVVGICVEEYRNGQLLSTNKRDFQFNVTGCISTAVNIESYTSTGDTAVIEGCGNITFVITRPAFDSDSNLTLYLSDSGSAVNGIDYSLLPDSIVIPAGQSYYEITIPTLFDELPEFLESFAIYISNDSSCIEKAMATGSIINSEEIELSSTSASSVICKDEETILTAVGSGGDGTLTYYWSNSSSGSEITVSPDTSKQYIVYVTDECGNQHNADTLTIYVVCEMILPNVFTPNGDGINDIFYIENLYMHPNSRLEIFNRWGKQIYSDNNYDNNWNAKNFSEGTYFYILDSPEIRINDPNSTSNSFYYDGVPLTGFVTILK